MSDAIAIWLASRPPFSSPLMRAGHDLIGDLRVEDSFDDHMTKSLGVAELARQLLASAQHVIRKEL